METSLDNDLIRQIKRYQDHIQQVDPLENDSQRVLHYMRKLSKLPIKLDELEKTGVGKTINALRKRNGSIAEQATLLVAKWKSIVKKQVQDETEIAEKNGEHSSVTDYDSSDDETQTVDDVSITTKQSRIHEISLKTNNHKIKDQCGNAKNVSKHEAKVNLNNIKKENISERKRKHSNDDKEKSIKKDKCKKTIVEENMNSLNISKNTTELNKSSKLIKMNDPKEEKQSDAHKKKEKFDEKKLNKKEHDKKHKSSKHHKEDKHHHRHHSKNSHHDKKRDEKLDTSKHRSEKKLENRSTYKYDESESSNSNKVKKSSRKDSTASEFNRSTYKEEINDENYTKTENDDNNGGFGAALLEISQTTTTNKKKSISSKSSNYQGSPLSNLSSQKSTNELELLSNDVKLEPLDLDDYFTSHNDFYSPKDESYRLKPDKQKTVSEDEAFSSMTTKKNLRTKVFSGFKATSNNMKFPTLFELCVRVLQDNFDALEYTGGVPFDVLKPILEKVSVEQLYSFEEFNPYLIGETDELWKFHAKKHFRKAERLEYESWRELYLRCLNEREEKLQSLTENISQSLANSTPARKTKLAYLDSVVKPPRNVARSQAKHGTGSGNVPKSPKKQLSSQTATQSVKERMVKEIMTSPTAVSIPSKSNLFGSTLKKKKAPLMQKSLQLLKGLKR